MVVEHYLLIGILAAGATQVIMGLRDRKNIEEARKRSKNTTEKERRINRKVTYLEVQVAAMRNYVTNGDTLLYSLSWDDESRDGPWRFIASEGFAEHVNMCHKHVDIAPSNYGHFIKQCKQRVQEINQCL